MGNEDIYLEKNEAIATLVFNRPDKYNALTQEMWKKIPQFVKEVEEDKDIKVLVLRGKDEKAFASGADISEFQTVMSDSKSAKIYNEVNRKAESALKSMKKPSIALIQGICIGGGCEIAVSCDFRISDTTGRFAITPANLGLVYSLSPTKNLVELVGPSFAKYILMSAKHIDADFALRIGLVNEVFPPEEVEKKTYEFAKTICEKAQYTVRTMKYFINEISEGIMEETEEMERLRLESFDTEDYQEGVKAFLEKRKPNFQYK